MTDIRTVVETALTALDEAKGGVSAAERQLEQLLSEMKIAPRAEKTSVSKTVELALQVLRAARTKVEDAESTLEKEKTNL